MKDKTGYYDKFIMKVPNFPKEGILFYDITNVLLKVEAYESLIRDVHAFYSTRKIDCIAAIESRGYLIGAPLALKMSLPLLLIRKEGKLPREVLKEKYELEYGFSSIEIHKDDVKQHSNILLVDDILATGGTLKAAAMLLEKAGGIVSDIFCFIELVDINGRDILREYSFNSLVKYS
ncbi:adenine phosphoribosyltransferase [Borrelia miyamotoi]|uniref:Adenine phosphoribosyltransferase n=1 Tax=Borrelia miyamotoi TaxID=47466 RepID=A0AAX3JLV0_9SPIR|nr:adenine phosphoribosyltransferase [Borrelia miyamotoi]QFP41604.1 adenine phosphoribosyltransferase [Borrelia miyamotoi]QFP47724.1 adenine phosphoribosyltransferase [Borrelia miyamotoi]QGT55486.1 adenine phosphoribosyltransferase [Borrelia miyamotoi]QGT56267.1 adenine phosphoribosyltransferase [Borrelia miyamotoi]WAZ71511.1 adenine phosphoribosyltransferase [Borrelia miyamotoi]